MNYDEYAALFDKVFPLNETTLAFLKKEFAGKKDILDLGCGRGLYTGALSWDFHMVGMDLSPQMIEAARAQFPHVEFSVQDMQKFDGTFQGIFIIGNTLVHLPSRQAIQDECRYLYDHLTRDGKLVIQIINYDRIYQHQIDHLPEIRKDGIRFIRKYELQDEKVLFHSTLMYKGEEHRQTVPLYPLKSQQLVEILKECSFQDIRLYGGFGYQDFSKDSSIQLVVTAQK